MPERPPSFNVSAGSTFDENHAGTQPKSSPATVVASEREEQDGKIEVQVGLGGQRPLGHHCDQAGKHGVSHADSESPTHQGEQDAFGKQLNEDGPWSRAQRAAHGELFLPRHAAGQQQVGDVYAGDQEHKSDSA